MTENLVKNVNFARLCRCCALEHNLMYDIFCGTCSNAQTYCEVVMECAPIQLFRGDGLPSLVCHECVRMLESFVTFQRKCVESESVLQEIRRNRSSDKRETFDSNRDKRDYPTLDHIKEESNDIDEPTEPEIEFDDPEKNSKCLELKLHHEIKIEDTIVNEGWPDTNSQIDRSERLFENSVKKEFVGDDRDEPGEPHLDTDRTEEELDEHRKAHTSMKPYSCDVCEKTFSFKSGLSKHRYTHMDDTYECDRCDKSFNARWKLNEHLKIHDGVKPYSCDVCEKSFVTRSKLTQHRKTHAKRRSREKRFSCDRCDRLFVTNSDLNSHRKVHTGEKSYGCEKCEKSFAHKSDLTVHERIHTGERPYPCDVCGKSFVTKSKLNRHRNIHAGEKPYACDECDKSFKRKIKLKEHRKIHRS